MKKIILFFVILFLSVTAINAQILYNTTFNSGPLRRGSINKFNVTTKTFDLKRLFDSQTGFLPYSGITQALDGKLYGTTYYGGPTGRGVLYSYDPITSDFKIVHEFDVATGDYSFNKLLLGTDGKLYGTTIMGGTGIPDNAGDGYSNYGGFGTVFSFDPATSNYAVLYNFNFTNGAYPRGQLAQSSDGTLYGTTESGGGEYYGVLYSINPSTGNFKQIKTFSQDDGQYPSGLVISADNKIVGMTTYGGVFSYGTIFSYDPATLTFTKLIDLAENQQSDYYQNLMQASDGNFYGTSFGNYTGGNIFSFNAKTSVYTDVKDFNEEDGFYSFGGLMQATDKNIYGSTLVGGVNGRGTIFSYNPSSSNFSKLYDYKGNYLTRTFTPFVEVKDMFALPVMVALVDTLVDFGSIPAASILTYHYADGTTGFSNPSTFSTSPSALGGIVTETWTATDKSQRNLAAVYRKITVNAGILPVMTSPGDITMTLPCGETAVQTSIPFTNNLKDGALLNGSSNQSTITAIPGNCGALLTETWTANDAAGRPLAPVSRTITLGQNLGTIENFIYFSGSGAVTAAASSDVTGNVGTNTGAITGFTGDGQNYTADATTTQAKNDLLNLYIHLSNLKITKTNHTPEFGGEAITAGVYSLNGAGSIGGELILDGEGSSNAVFVIKFNGALKADAGSTIKLIGGAQSANVFWVAEGAIAMGASTTMMGTFISHTGAVSIGAASKLEGRMLSTVGAVSMGGGVATLPVGPGSLPVICVTENTNTTLGTIANYAVFASVGAVSNTGSSGVIGDIGTNVGTLSNFDGPATTLIGYSDVANSVTSQANSDLQNAYNTLAGTIATGSHPSVFGYGETLAPGVYEVAGAASIVGDLNLNGDVNSVFILKIGGALSTAAQSKVTLSGGTVQSNVFWVVEGAITLGSSSFMKGSLIAHNAAITMGAAGNLEGRLLSTTGAVSCNSSVIYTKYTMCPTVVPNRQLALGNRLAHPSKNKIELTKNLSNTLFSDNQLVIYPNPSSTGIIKLDYSGDITKVRAVQIYNLQGACVYSSRSYQSDVNISGLRTGIYMVNFLLDSTTISQKLIVVN